MEVGGAQRGPEGPQDKPSLSPLPGCLLRDEPS